MGWVEINKGEAFVPATGTTRWVNTDFVQTVQIPVPVNCSDDEWEPWDFNNGSVTMQSGEVVGLKWTDFQAVCAELEFGLPEGLVFAMETAIRENAEWNERAA